MSDVGGSFRAESRMKRAARIDWTHGLRPRSLAWPCPFDAGGRGRSRSVSLEFGTAYQGAEWFRACPSDSSQIRGKLMAWNQSSLRPRARVVGLKQAQSVRFALTSSPRRPTDFRRESGERLARRFGGASRSDQRRARLRSSSSSSRRVLEASGGLENVRVIRE